MDSIHNLSVCLNSSKLKMNVIGTYCVGLKIMMKSLTSPFIFYWLKIMTRHMNPFFDAKVQHINTRMMCYLLRMITFLRSKAKVTQKKRRSKSKKKYFKQGQQSAHRHVFRQVLCDLYSKIMKVLIWTKFESCESRARQSRLRQHSVSWPIDEETWSIVGHEYLTLYANAEIRHGVSIHFTDLDVAKIFDINDNPLERTTMHGLFEAVDVLFAVNTKSLILTIWFNMKYTDPNGIPHLEHI
eukprot:529335_1